jgi:DNA topoisomerase I
MNLVIVESPAKAKTINKYLGSDYRVLASFGHVRDLPSKDGSVNPDEDFAMSWESDTDSLKRMKDIASALKDSDALYLATDPDREGEAISWHVLEILRGKNALKDKTIKRVVFNEITKSAVTDAMAHPRELDQEMVDAYLARRALDYGANCRARAQPAVFSPWRCALSASGNWRSKPSYRRNTGPLTWI